MEGRRTGEGGEKAKGRNEFQGYLGYVPLGWIKGGRALQEEEGRRTSGMRNWIWGRGGKERERPKCFQSRVKTIFISPNGGSDWKGRTKGTRTGTARTTVRNPGGKSKKNRGNGPAGVSEEEMRGNSCDHGLFQWRRRR